MSDVGIGWELLDSAEEEFLEAVRKQSIGRPCVVRPSKNLASKFTIKYYPLSFPFLCFFFRIYVIRNTRVEDNNIIPGRTERRLDGVKPSLRPVLTNDNHVDRGSAHRDPGFSNQSTTPRGAATGKAEKKKMMMMMMAQIPVPTVKAYARPSSYTAPSTGRHMDIAKTTVAPSSIRPLLRLQPNENVPQRDQRQQLKAVAASAVTMATPTATCVHHLGGPAPLSSPLQDVANRWARELDAARERRKELKRQFRRDFGIGYCGHYY